MADNMLTCVALAICRAHGNPDEYWELFIDEARAAIEAMREPSNSMLDVAAAYAADALLPGVTATFVGCYRGMIDAALEEPK